MAVSHNLGFPRIGSHREMKKAVEAYWRGELSQSQLLETGQQLQQQNWALQAQAGLDLIVVGDFSWYDHVLDHSVMLGCIPERFGEGTQAFNLDTYFCMARGQAPNGQEATACEMTKWFNTNYHYIVPEFRAGQTFHLASERLFDTVSQALKLGYKVKPTLLGPLSFLWLGKTKGDDFNKLELLDALLPVYERILAQLQAQGVEWVQIDEPILVLDLPEPWKAAYQTVYQRLHKPKLKLLLTSYFGGLGDQIELACTLPVNGLHIDVCSDPKQLTDVLAALPHDKILSVGIVSGRNIWRTDLRQALATLQPIAKAIGQRLWIAPSCSLLHVPVDLDNESVLDPELKSWLAFAKQKVIEVAQLCRALNQGEAVIVRALTQNHAAIASRKNSSKTRNSTVRARVANLTVGFEKRQNPYLLRAKSQKQALKLPSVPTTTIGSFPQTKEIRQIRRDYRVGKIAQATYESRIQAHISEVVAKQEALGLDVLVHGEAERNDMVEYFGELLAGFAFTRNGWVQSYGSRCVKPPIIYGDVYREGPMTVKWSQYAQSLTKRPMKGMLTGPVTILFWSFVRDDQPKADTCSQIALALRDEVTDLEAAGIGIIQIDEPAFREGLPLRRKDWQSYLAWAVRCFRIASGGAKDETQIHTHMCYSEFNDIIEAIARLDADVISIESSRSDMKLLEAFKGFNYPNEIGPGVYDIHSPRIPSVDEMTELLKKALDTIPVERLWVNPDCGLKTRNWAEIESSLINIVTAAKNIRAQYTK